MKITSIPVNNSKVLAVTASGYASSPTISRAWNITSLTEDFELVNSDNGAKIPFFVIPLSEGVLTVGLADDPGTPFTITAAEVTSFQGQPMLYLIKRIFLAGTTVTSFNVGI